MTEMQVRFARPVSNLWVAATMYVRGLDLREVDRFEDHAGFDGVILQFPERGFHFELTYCRLHPLVPAPTPEDLLVLYEPSPTAWRRRCEALAEAGFRQVASFNPYWDLRGRTFEDQDGYRTIINNSHWP